MRVLVVRPAPSCHQLVEQLSTNGIFATAAPLLSFSAAVDLSSVPDKFAQLQPQDIVVAVSPRAIEYTDQSLKEAQQQWRRDLIYVAVGQTSAQTWLKCAKIDAKIPSTQDSEGLIQLSIFKQQNKSKVLILRGKGGREELGNHFTQAGVTFCYVETYQRHWDTKQAQLQSIVWQNDQLDTLVVSSGEQLASLFHSLDQKGQQWVQNCRLLIPSQRIATQAATLGIKQITCTDSASNHSFFQALKAMNNSG